MRAGDAKTLTFRENPSRLIFIINSDSRNTAT